MNELDVLRVSQAVLRRELARRSTLAFCDYTKPDWITARHHGLLCEIADRVIDGSLKRVMVSLPPRHTKSEIFSIRMPARKLGLEPSSQIIHASYAASLSNEFSRQVRALVRDDLAYRRLFPGIQLDPERQRLDDWRTVSGGGFRSVGVGGGLTGHGGDLIVIDDPVKEGDEQSPAMLEGIFTWFLSAARTRLSPGGAIVIVMTRWHPNDLIGRLIEVMEQDGTGEQWEVINIPALAGENDILGRQPNEALWPERFNEGDLAALRQLSPRYFEALYQQNPQPEDVALFRGEDFIRGVVTEKQVDRFAWCFDLAFSEQETADWNVWGRWRHNESNGQIAVTDVTRVQQQWPKTKAEIHRLMDRYPDDDFVFPAHIIEQLALQELKAERPEDRQRLRKVRFPANSDKRSRAQAYSDRVASGRAWVEPGSAGDHFVREHSRFPDRHDDCVDMSSVATHHFGLHKAFDFLVGKIEEREYEPVA